MRSYIVSIQGVGRPLSVCAGTVPKRRSGVVLSDMVCRAGCVSPWGLSTSISTVTHMPYLMSLAVGFTGSRRVKRPSESVHRVSICSNVWNGSARRYQWLGFQYIVPVTRAFVTGTSLYVTARPRIVTVSGLLVPAP